MKTREEALSYGLSFPDTYQEAPFHDDNWQLIRVKGSKKAFLWVYEKDGIIQLNVKANPEWRDYWRDAFASVIPGYHQNKEHWNTILLDGTVPDDAVRTMIAESYDIITDSPTKRIYEAVKQIPRGKVATYGQIAALAGEPKMARAVGNALHKNTDPEHIPCYRVVNSKGELAAEFVFGGATVNVGGNKLTADTVTISSGNNYFANGSLIANGNMNINSDFNFGYGSAGGKLYANILSVAEGKTLTISGTGTTEIYERLDMNPTSNLNITNGTHNINVMKFISGASATKNAVKITGANVYLNKGKQASTTPYYNGVINASYSTGKSQVEITLSGSVLDLGSGELEYNEGTNDSKKLVFRLQNGSTMTNMGGLTCWGGKGLSFILDAGSKSSIQMLGKTSTCSGAETKFSAKNTSQQASITLGDDASGIMVFACMFYQSGSGYDYLCGRRATCTNVNGL